MKKDIQSQTVSCCIPAYNHEPFIGEAIQSFINQTYENLELIIINDGSTDRTHEIILSLGSRCKTRFKRFVYINRENRGLSNTLNQIIDLANGEFIAFLASDDINKPNRIQLLINYFNKLTEDYCAVFGDADFVDMYSNKIMLNSIGSATKDSGGYASFLNFYTRNRTLPEMDGTFALYGEILRGNFLPGASFIYRKKCLLDVGGYSEDNIIEDLDMYLKLLKKYKMYYVNTILCSYRIHESNTNTRMNQQLMIDTLKILLREEQYARGHGYLSEWTECYNKILLSFIKQKNISNFLSYYKKDLSFVTFLHHRLLNKVKQIICKYYVRSKRY